VTKAEDQAAPKQKCIGCENDLRDDLTYCRICHSAQDPKLCVVCKKAMPKEAKRCNHCSSFQGEAKYLMFGVSLATLLFTCFGLISGGVSGCSYVADRNSNTRFKVTSSDERRLYLKVWNTGRKPSTLVGYRLIFDKRPDKEAMLDLSDKDQADATNVIAPGSIAKIGLAIPLDATIPTSTRGKQYTEKERRELLPSPWVEQPLTLEVDVEESSDPCCFGIPIRFHHKRTDRFPAGRISRFIVGSMGG
jgi:hypothetical protein